MYKEAHELELDLTNLDHGVEGFTLETKTLRLDGESLTCEGLALLSNKEVKVELSPEAWKRVEEGRKIVDRIVESGQRVYGINTGFGSFASVAIENDKIVELQENLIRSHAAGVGEPLSPIRTRRLLALRINVLAKGRSGIRKETLQSLIDACNKWCLSYVPVKGTLGASGDLAPLSHLALGLMGEGLMWDVSSGKFANAADILKANGLKPIRLAAKEGLALINGTQLICVLGAEALYRAKNISILAETVTAMSLEALKGSVVAFDPAIHNARPHTGQILSAQRMRALLNAEKTHSEISDSHKFCGEVQDAYTLRCSPQVHGIGHDTIKFVERILTTEMNSATDNPMVFSEDGRVLSGGNFHGEYPAKVLDFLTIAVAEFGSISERRIERLVNAQLSKLPPFLVKEGGLNSGFMIAHCTAASLVSENKSQCWPASADSISTSAAKEDHVSNGGVAARKALVVVENVEIILAIELLAGCQAMEFHRPLKTTPILEKVHALVRSEVKPWDHDRFMQPDIEKVVQLIQHRKITDIVQAYLMKEFGFSRF